jgi:2',3'-cyclic-nucleotide 2'-phosphodiesterase
MPFASDSETPQYNGFWQARAKASGHQSLRELLLKLLFIGDIFGHAGRRIVADHLADIRSSQSIDLVIANCENSAAGFGVTPNVADELFGYGIDVMTSGNHIWDKRDIYPYLERTPRLIRPANYPPGAPGAGICISQTSSGVPYAVMNLQGRVYMPHTDCPFRKADELIGALPAEVKVRFVDFHAEVTSEKMAMGWYLDGRVSAIVGTHTHIPTADTRILPGGTAYQTDSGMTGPYDSIIGVEKDPVLTKFLTAMPIKMEAARQAAELHAVIVDVDEATGKAVSARRHTVNGS